MNHIGFKEENGPDYQKRLEDEFWNHLDPRMCGMAHDLGFGLYRKAEKQLILTCIGRTKEENDAVGGSEYSAHLFRNACCHAWDARVHHLTGEEVDWCVRRIKNRWDPKVYYVVVHGKGPNRHLHTNVRYNHRNI